MLINNDDDDDDDEEDLCSGEVDGVVEVGSVAEEAHVEYGVDETVLVLVLRQIPLHRRYVTEQYERHLHHTVIRKLLLEKSGKEEKKNRDGTNSASGSWQESSKWSLTWENF